MQVAQRNNHSPAKLAKAVKCAALTTGEVALSSAMVRCCDCIVLHIGFEESPDSIPTPVSCHDTTRV